MRVAVLLLSLLLTACAHRALPPAPAQLQALLDGSALPQLPEPSPEPLFALSPAMRDFVLTELRQPVRQHGAQLGLYHALRAGGHLRIDYDAGHTRTAAETFEQRAGNCLSLVLMTAALAREMGLSVGYQWVDTPEIWTLSERFQRLNGHVNLTLGQMPRGLSMHEMGRYTIDFQPVEDARLARVRPLTEATLVAMFFNNRAVEWMEQGRLDQALAQLRAAVRADPAHLNTLNTLGVLFHRAGDLPRAEAALQLLLAQQPGHAHAASNLAKLWRAQGREAEALALEQRLPPSPFADFDTGQREAAAGNWKAALAAFERQRRRTPEFHGLHLQLARVHLALGQPQQARRHLELAEEQAPTAGLRQAYQAKLQALRRLSS